MCRDRMSLLGGSLRLSELIGDYPAALIGEPDTPINGIAYDSREVDPGALFFCIPGRNVDGHDFLRSAVERGAAAGVVDHRVDVEIPQVVVECVRPAMAPLAARFYGDPTSQLTLVGVTGTNGKTTTTFILDAVFRQAGKKTGLVGTVEYRIGDEVLPVTRTTPEAADLQGLFRRMVDAGVEAVAMEVSSHAIDLNRVDACDFDVLVFTNLTQDHLDYHKTMEEYARAKKAIFDRGAGRAHVINVDDELGRQIAEDCGAHVTYALQREADLIAHDIRLGPSETSYGISGESLELRVRSPLKGVFNVYNSLAAAGAGLVLGIDTAAILEGLQSVGQVPGRFESIEAGQAFSVLVDYAHTPDSLQQAIAAARRITTGSVIVVFGCGGDRDVAKRPLMGQAAAEAADLVVVTSDNPRGERPEDIIDQIEQGVRGVEGVDYVVEVDRREAIAYAFSRAKTGDTVLIAGKGHETGQQFADHTIEFDDRIVAKEELAKT